MKKFLAPNIVLFIFAIGVFFLFYWIIRKTNFSFNQISIPIKSICVVTFIIQVFIYYNIFFMTDWDVMMAIDTAELYVNGTMNPDNMAWPNIYFSMYPTNQFILVVMIWIFEFSSMIGLKTIESWVFSAVIIQCIMSCVVGYLIYMIIKDESDSELAAIGGYFLFFFLIALSGWELIPYGDSLSLLYPILIIRIYQKMQNSKHWLLCWIFMVGVTYWGYHIKATGFLVFIAIIIAEITYVLTNKNINIKNCTKAIIVGFCMIIVFNALHSKMMNNTGLTINPELNSEISLNLAISLNEDTNGMYSAEDVSMATSIPTKSERDAVCLALAKQRLLSYNPITMFKHLTKKTLAVYNDGTYAWGVGGVFFYETFSDKNQVSKFLKDVFYTDRKYYDFFASFKQMLWMFTLVMSLFVVLKKDRIILSIELPLIAITVFEMIFEALARRVYIFVPLFIIACALGCKNLTEKIGETK